MMRIVIINGYPQSGKDTFIDMVGEYVSTFRMWTSTPAKEALKILGWDGVEKTPEIRKLLAKLKKISVKHFDNTTKYVLEKIDDVHPLTKVVFIHCREPEEIDMLKKLLGAETLFIEREEASKQAFSNKADANVENYMYDITLCNDGTLEELKNTAAAYANYLKKGAK